MPVISLVSPASGSIVAAYRPITISAVVTSTSGGPLPPIVYCDIYFGGIYYKTISKTKNQSLTVFDSTWIFDIQDAAQEYLRKLIAPNGGTFFVRSTELITEAFVRVRSSAIDTNGFITPEGTVPVQGTSGTPSSPGTGTESARFLILNATLQHEDNQDLRTHLDSFIKREWTSEAAPLTHRPDNYKITLADSDFYPLVYTEVGSTKNLNSIILRYRYRGQSTWRTKPSSVIPTLAAAVGVYFIPNGPKNLQPLFPTDVSFFDIAEYYVQVVNHDGVIFASTNISQVQISLDSYVRIHFVNALGGVDAINFYIVDQEQETKSDVHQRSTTAPLQRSVHSLQRFNVRSNDTFTAVNVDFNEEDMDFIDELFRSPLAWIQWKGVQGQSDDYLPILISDGKQQKMKFDERFVYEVTLEFKMSHEKFTMRN
jgi:hypothetical protein